MSYPSCKTKGRTNSNRFDPQILEVHVGTKRKDLPVGDDRALFALSQGRCYRPGCRVRTFQKVNGHFSSQLDKAHIYAHSPGGPRFNPNMTQAQRDSWENHILLCKPDHDEVDAVANLHKFPAALLMDWKQQRENGLIGDLPELRGISDLDLEQLLVHQVEGVLSSIEKLEGVSKGIADELKRMVEEQFVAPQIDLDAVNSLSEATWRLHRMSFPDYANFLSDAVHRLDRMSFPDQVNILRGAAEELGKVQDLDVYSLKQVHMDLDHVADRLSDQLRDLEEGTHALRKTGEQVTMSISDGQNYWLDDVGKFWQFIAKSFTVGLVVGGAAIGVIWAWAAGAF